MPTGHTLICLLGGLLLGLPVGWAGEAHASEDLASTGFFRDQDTLPGSYRFYQQLPGGEARWWGMGPGRDKVRRASFQADAHEVVADYSPQTRCQQCHKPQTKDLHGLRMDIACVQCHRNVPVAGVFHYYSPLNPIRRHAYVCAKCHEGATASYAAYVVHAPNPALASTLKEFPVLAYAFWIMVVIAVGTFVLFLPHTVLWGIRELFIKKKTKENQTSEPDSKDAD